MRQKPAQNKRTQPLRNPFACPGWRRFVMRAVAADQMAMASAARRVTTTGETLH
jgi:hypothetical protein